MDDTWGLEDKTSIVAFQDCCIPLNQAPLLELFNFLNVPWDWSKQVWGSELEIIGFHIDLNTTHKIGSGCWIRYNLALVLR